MRPRRDTGEWAGTHKTCTVHNPAIGGVQIIMSGSSR